MSQKLTDEQRRNLYGGELRPPYKLARLNDCDGDLSKRWSVEFYVWNQNLNRGKGALERKQKRFSQKNFKERKEAAEGFILEINEFLLLGYHIKLDGQKQHEDKTGVYLTIALDLVQEILKVKLKKKTYMDYSGMINSLKEWIEVNCPDKLAGDFTRIDALNFIDNSQIERNLSNRTRNNILMRGKTIFSHMLERGYVEQNPFKEIRKERATQPQNFPFRKHHKDLLLPAMKERDLQLYYACSFIYYLFLRPSELRLLKIGDIFWEERKVKIDNNNKTGKAKYPSISKALERIILQMNLLELDPELYVFSKNGQPGEFPLGKNTLSTRFMEIRNDLGVDSKYTFYCWKHTGNFDCVLKGVNIKAIQEQNGHEDLASTDNYLRSIGIENNEQIKALQPKLF